MFWLPRVRGDYPEYSSYTRNGCIQYPDGISEADAATTHAGLDALRALETEAPELERLEGLLDHFNIFKTIGFVSDDRTKNRERLKITKTDPNHGDGR